MKSNVTFIEGDVMSHGFAAESFGFIASIATLHHLPLVPALTRFRDLLRPGGTLVVIGLYRLETFGDYVAGAVGAIGSAALRAIHRYEPIAAPIREPVETLAQIREAVTEVLPSARLTREWRTLRAARYARAWRRSS